MDEDNFLTINGDLSLLSNLKKRVKENKQNELLSSILKNNKKANSSFFYINKQCAFNNELRLIDEQMSPLGDILFEINCENIDETIKWFNL